MVQVWFRSFCDLPAVANRRAVGRPGDARRPAAVIPRMGCTCCYADRVAIRFRCIIAWFATVSEPNKKKHQLAEQA